MHIQVLFLGVLFYASVGFVYCYERPPPGKTIFIPQKNGDPTAPEQVHISLVGEDKMRISWITKGECEPIVRYGTSSGSYKHSITGETTKYRYVIYNSGRIHNAVIGPLEPETIYYYRCGPNSTEEFSFKTPPAKFPIKFVVVDACGVPIEDDSVGKDGDLGQSEWSKKTLEHITKANYDVLILPGDLSYAFYIQSRWDSFGRLVQPLASQRPWMVAPGNHEIENIPVIHREPFTAYNARWHMPFEESKSNSNLYYSFNRAGVHAIVLTSYTDFDPSSAQYKWLQADLANVDRQKTPWIVIIMHAPWYNSNTHHQGEKTTQGMKMHMEDLIYRSRVDVVFTGHVHAYERFTRVYKDKADDCGPVHITIGDGGNSIIESLAKGYINPQPKISLFREASFGHGQFIVQNATHARWTWNRNEDDVATIADTAWITSTSNVPACKI